MYVSKIRCDEKSEKFCKIFLELNRAARGRRNARVVSRPLLLSRVQTLASRYS